MIGTSNVRSRYSREVVVLGTVIPRAVNCGRRPATQPTVAPDLARAGRHGEDEDVALEHNLAIIGFREIPSLESAREYDAVYKIVEKRPPEVKSRAIGNFAGQL